MKTLIVGQEARKKAVLALKKIAEGIGSTLGPRGMPFIFEKENFSDGWGSAVPMVTKDGITVLRSMSFVDPVENAVHQLCIQASSHTVIAAGDGTSSTVLLAAEVASIIEKHLQKYNKPQSLARQVLAEAQQVMAAIKTEADKSEEMARLVAETSTNGDSELTDYVLEAIAASSAFGSIVIERDALSPRKYEIRKQEGLVSGKGYEATRQLASSISPKVGANTPFEMESPKIICFDGDLVTQKQIGLILNRMFELYNDKFQLIVCAYDIGIEPINICAQVNLQRPGVKIWLHSMRDTSEVNCRWHKQQDLAAFTGAQVMNFSHLEANEWGDESLGSCTKSIVAADKTTYIGRGENNWLPKRAMQNENSLPHAHSEMDREHIRMRNAELTNGLVKLVVGGGHLANIQERSDRADDAIKAAQACLRTGALPGCGASYVRGAFLANIKRSGFLDKLLFRKSSILGDALPIIHEKIMDNYGGVSKRYFNKGETVAIRDDKVLSGNFKDLRIADSYESISSVIRNGVELGILVATLGGVSLTTDLDEIEKLDRAAKTLKM